jgi:hypothetical protein
MDTTQILLWISAGGGASLIFSWLVENWQLYQKLSAAWKKIIYYIGVSVLVCLAYAGTQYIPVDILAIIDPYIKLIAAALGLSIGGTAWHSIRKQANSN